MAQKWGRGLKPPPPAPPSARSLHSEETDTNKADKEEQRKSYKDAAPDFEERMNKLGADIKVMHQKLAEAKSQQSAIVIT